MIPAFPAFKRIELADRADVEAYTSRFEPFSDFNFTSLWAWDVSGDRMISQLNGNLVVRFSDYRTDELFLSFLGDRAPNDTARRLIEYSGKLGLAAELRLVPEISIADTSPLRWREDRDNFDYLYATRQHVDLTGPEFKRARNFVRKFERDCPHATFQPIDPTAPGTREKIIDLLERWAQSRNDGSSEIEHEREAIKRLLNTISQHPVLVTAVFASDLLLAFSLDEMLPNNHCICHFWKADTAYAGIYDYLLHHKARCYSDRGVAYLNYEQDLGIEGLRKSKTAYRPVSFLKKYRIGPDGR